MRGLRVLRDGIARTDHEDFFSRKNGSFIPVVYTSAAIVYEGKITGVVVVCRDLTHGRQVAPDWQPVSSEADRSRKLVEPTPLRLRSLPPYRCTIRDAGALQQNRCA